MSSGAKTISDFDVTRSIYSKEEVKMRLYHQLEDFEIDGAIQCATEMIIGDLIAGELALGNFTDAELEGLPQEMAKENKLMKETMATIKKLETEKDRVDFVIDNERVMEIVHKLAHENIKGFYYMDYGDRCLFPEDYAHDDESCPDCQEARKLEELSDNKEDEPQANIGKTTKHKKHSIN